MQIKLSLRQAVLSSLIFGGVLLALASVDARVRERVSDVVSGDDGLSPWGDRISDLGSALVTAVRHQSLENAPMLVFAAVGAVLFVFMIRTLIPQIAGRRRSPIAIRGVDWKAAVWRSFSQSNPISARAASSSVSSASWSRPS